ncbi:protein kinase [Nonomuraea sp. NPDC050310]|uniref:serine/threonine-protein kinase n=1 Tax=Nonomuraea sp. NPDC050310 TaxID=3154935 RepID=UPI00340E3617
MDPTGAAPLRPTDRREIGPYRLLGRLGEGGMGTVYLARAPVGRLVAVKVVKAEYANQQGFAARFHAEVENARRVASFCTAEVLDNGNADDGRPYMVTEYIAGTPLSEQIARFGQLDAGTLHGVALGVAAALAAIHNAGLVHRDLKPANVILSLSGPRVIDFGIARALDRETGFTLSGELLGSPGWWAPEQVRGLPITPAADVFAWGCVVAYAGNGRHPYGRGDVITLATRVLNTEPDLGALPAPLNELVRQATGQEPGERPTAQELVLALVGGGGPVRREVAADPPTVIATEMLHQSWQPPQNVVEGPDSAASGAAGEGEPQRKGGVLRRRQERRERERAERAALEQEFQEVAGPLAGGAGAVDAGLDEGVPGGSKEGSRPGERPAERDSAAGRGVYQEEGGQAPGTRHQGSGPQQVEPRQGSQPGGWAPQVEPGQGSQPGGWAPQAERGSQPGGWAPQVEPGSQPGEWVPQVVPWQVGAGVEGTRVPSEEDHTSPAEPAAKSLSARWLIAAGAALAALAVTGAILITATKPTTTTTPRASTGVSTPGQVVPSSDVGRRYALGDEVDALQLIVTGRAECGLTSYEEVTSSNGQLCVVRWTLINPSGTARPLGKPTVSLIDDQEAGHEPVSVELPATIVPGGRLDGVFVFDLAPYRKAARLSATTPDGSRQIEVRL